MRLNKYQIVLLGLYLALVAVSIVTADQGVTLDEIVLEISCNASTELIDLYSSTGF